MSRIKIENLSKRFTARRREAAGPLDPDRAELEEPDEPGASDLEQGLGGVFGKSDKDDEIWALRDIELTIEPGEKVGLIGDNGCGKSTLLNIVAGTTLPTFGRVRGSGQLISLSAIRSPIFGLASGRENLLMLCGILGIPKGELLERLDRIVEFAGIESSIDQRAESYPRGQYSRLAFAAAFALEPDVLIADEVFMVGDAEFRQKLLERLEEVTQRGTTLLVSSHQMEAIEKLCSRVIWLDEGRVREDGTAAEVIPRYIYRQQEGQQEERVAQLPAELLDDQGAFLNDQDAPLRLDSEFHPLGAFQRCEDRATAALAGSRISAVRRIVVEEWAKNNKRWQSQDHKLLEKRQRQRPERRRRSRFRFTKGGRAKDLGIIRRVRCLDFQGQETREAAPGEDLVIEFAIEAFKPDIHVDATLDLWTNGVLVARSRLPTLFTAPHDGCFFISVKVDGALFHQAVQQQLYKATVWLAFREAGDIPPGHPCGPNLALDDDHAILDDETQPGEQEAIDTGKALERLAAEKGMVLCSVLFVVRGEVDRRFLRPEYGDGLAPAPLLYPSLTWSVERDVRNRKPRD